MTLLLDTHVLLWLLVEPQEIRSDVQAEIVDTGNDLTISSASAFEIAQKTRVGKL